MKTKDRAVRVPARDRKVSEKRDESIGLDGVWPRVNRELIKDYPKDFRSTQYGVFRIHLDIPITNKDDFDNLESAFTAHNLNTARDLLNDLAPDGDPGSDEHHAWETIQAALGS